MIWLLLSPERVISKRTAWALLVAILTFLIAGLFRISAGISAGLVGGVLWWGLIERPAKPTLLRGGLFGLLTVLLSHPLMWIIGAAIGDPLAWVFLGFPIEGSLLTLSGLSELLTNLLFATVMGLLGGFFTIPIGIVAGLVFVILRRRFQSDDGN